MRIACLRLLLGGWLLALGQMATATMIAEADFLYDWNLIVFDDLESRKSIEGKAFVGGGKDVTDEVAKQGQELLRATMGLSENLRSLASTDRVGTEKDALIIRSGEKLGVFDLSLDDLKGFDTIRVDIADGTSVVINVAGEAGKLDAKFDADGIGKNSQLIWNFYEAKEIEFDQSFFGTVLSPFASVRNDATFTGTLVADSLDQRGALRMGSYMPTAESGGGEGVGTGGGGGGLETVSVAPEPANWLLLLTGFGAIGAVLRRRPRPSRSLATA